jgi:hypothetical protein
MQQRKFAAAQHTAIRFPPPASPQAARPQLPDETRSASELMGDVVLTQEGDSLALISRPCAFLAPRSGCPNSTPRVLEAGSPLPLRQFRAERRGSVVQG